jgi:hypothetical protein
MAALSGDFTGCSIFIYDISGNHLGSTKVTRYSKDTLRIEVEELPQPLNTGDTCQVLILTQPSPCEYQGRVKKEGKKKVIALFFGHEKENRKVKRYNVSFTAKIENLVCEGKAYPLLTPLEVTLINISQGGARFAAPNYTMFNGDRFQMRMKISDSDKVLIAEVVNNLDVNNTKSEYGCRFLIGSEKVV